jgi:heme/copper-type cytochrome/quinol oxidase subunit 4
MVEKINQQLNQESVLRIMGFKIVQKMPIILFYLHLKKKKKKKKKERG